MDMIWNIVDGAPPCPAGDRPEVEKLLEELIRIGRDDDYLSLTIGQGFNMDKRHIRARAIGKRFHELGGMGLMQWALKKVQRRIKRQLAEHLEYAWDGVGEWKA
jgi:hypothetical protein